MDKTLETLSFGKGDVSEVIFRHGKTVKATKTFIRWLKTNGGEASRGEVSAFAHELSKGRIEEGFTYSRKNFYHTLLWRFLDLDLISLQSRYDPESGQRMLCVYAHVFQDIPKRPPQALGSWWRLAWEVAPAWNQEFSEEGT